MDDPHNRPVLGNSDLMLRAPIAADVEARHALGSHPEILHMFGVDPATVRPLEPGMAERWVEYHLQEPLAFMIVLNGALVGDLRLHTVLTHDRRASMAISLLHPDFLDKGIGTRAMTLLIDHAFGAMGLNRITLRLIAYNHRALAAYKKLGFVVEGREREAARMGEIYHDDIIMGLLASDWQRRASND